MEGTVRRGLINCETVYSPYLRRLESLTIWWCNHKGSTFYSVIFKTLSVGPAGVELTTSRMTTRCWINWATGARYKHLSWSNSRLLLLLLSKNNHLRQKSQNNMVNSNYFFYQLVGLWFYIDSEPIWAWGIIYNYPPKGRWIVVDIYRDVKRRGIYPPLFTDPEGDSCFSIYQIRWIKKCCFNFFFWNFRETTFHFSFRSQNSE